MTTLYGIKNCDTMKKAMRWLDAQGVDYSFHDYKKEGIDEAALRQAIAEHGWEQALNRRGPTWRKLPEDLKSAVDSENAVQVAADYPSVVKRPLLVQSDKTYLGFSEEAYQEVFKK